MKDLAEKSRLYKQAFALLAHAQALILAARARHEQMTEQKKKAA
jgi:mannose/cellobiose epimerase-like protein (N-acyl-D-glucosamine 2-epimerase family)